MNPQRPQVPALLTAGTQSVLAVETLPSLLPGSENTGNDRQEYSTP